MSRVALRVVRSVVPVALYLDMARLTTRGLVRSRRLGIRLARMSLPIAPVRSVAVPVVMPAARMTWSRAGVQGNGEAGAVRGGAGGGGCGVGDRGAQGLVGDQQGVDFLLDAVRGPGVQDTAAQDGGLELGVGRLDFVG